MNVLENLQSIRADLDDAELVAVSKRQSMERIQEALDAGQRVFGENRVQEAYEHWQDLKDAGHYPDLKLHLIGPLQSNKVSDAVTLFDVIEVLDREKLAKYLCNEMDKQNRFLPCYIQVNTGAEPQKSGILVSELKDFYYFCKDECALQIDGLMCIPPVDEPPAVHFAFLSKLADELGLKKLSMGMSADYKKAIALGATSVRVGSGVFGNRLS